MRATSLLARARSQVRKLALEASLDRAVWVADGPCGPSCPSQCNGRRGSPSPGPHLRRSRSGSVEPDRPAPLNALTIALQPPNRSSRQTVVEGQSSRSGSPCSRPRTPRSASDSRPSSRPSDRHPLSSGWPTPPPLPLAARKPSTSSLQYPVVNKPCLPSHPLHQRRRRRHPRRGPTSPQRRRPTRCAPPRSERSVSRSSTRARRAPSGRARRLMGCRNGPAGRSGSRRAGRARSASGAANDR
jgi:hypothetical protein